MSYLAREIRTHPLTVTISGPARGVIVGAPLSETDPVAVLINQVATNAGAPMTFPKVAWSPRVTFARDGTGSPAVRFPEVGDTALLVFDDQGRAWLLDFWPGALPDWSNPSPTLSSISPRTGPVGTIVTLTGSAFYTGATSVLFGDVGAGSMTVESPTTITVGAPEPLVSIPAGGLNVDVQVVSSFGSSAASLGPGIVQGNATVSSPLIGDMFTYTPRPLLGS